MGLLVMIAGLVVFLGAHTLTTQRELRAQIISSTGEGTYKIGCIAAKSIQGKAVMGRVQAVLVTVGKAPVPPCRTRRFGRILTLKLTF